MRVFIGSLLALAAAVLLGAGFLAPVAAQQAPKSSLPSTHFGSEQPVSPHGFNAAPGFANAPVAHNPDSPDARAVGETVCTACHTQETANFAHTIHALGMNAALAADPGTATCESCHGGGSRHIESPTTPGSIIAFTKDGGTDVATQATSCLGCHSGGQRDQWAGSVHQRNDLSCSDCHNPMAKFSSEGLLAKPSISETCAGCHQDVRQQFNRRSHMPLPEGQMSCADCHNPHGTINASLLKTDTVNETCYQCHAEKRGPMLFEHAPVRDSCLNCHTPHGSNQQALLVAPVPFLCQQCHSHVRHPNDLHTGTSLAGQPGADERLIARGCISCHSQVHGSNHPSGPRLHK
ncbi:DmsE family decaheme c-type cytochrome [Luteimonas sp. MJ204]|uniref:DmsE family decaheme c-type cytochrome n=1 Tax=Luteimonas sp. MJ145 TaxID=3129234 RepID=UPI0031BB817B